MVEQKIPVGEIVVTLYEDGSIFMMCKTVPMKKVVSTLANAIILFEGADEDE